MKQISINQATAIQDSIIAKTGGDEGVANIALLESALLSPFQTFGGQELYPTLLEKAAQVGWQISNSHPFLDGNKRMGVHLMLLLLLINGVTVTATADELVDLGLQTADGLLLPQNVYNWLVAHTGA